MNPHLFTFLVSFILLVMLVDIRKLQVSIYGGIIAAVYKLIVNVIAVRMSFWVYHRVYENLPVFLNVPYGINLFMIGIAFTMGILFLQLLPENIYLQLLHAVMWTVFYVLMKYILSWFGLMTYIYLPPYGASHVLLFLLSLAWVKTNLLKSGKSQIA